MENGNQPTNPHLVYTHSGEVQEYSKGLTKREYFAGLAMQGLLAGNAISHSDVPNYAVRLADKVIGELEITK